MSACLLSEVITASCPVFEEVGQAKLGGNGYCVGYPETRDQLQHCSVGVVSHVGRGGFAYALIPFRVTDWQEESPVAFTP